MSDRSEAKGCTGVILGLLVVREYFKGSAEVVLGRCVR